MAEIDKMTRKEVLQPSKVEKLMYSFVDHAYRKKIQYTILVISLVILLLIIWGVDQYLQIEHTDRSNLFYEARSKINDSTLSEDLRISKGLAALKEFANSESQSQLSVIALMESGKIFAKQSKFDEAALEFKKALKHPEASNFLKNVSRLSLSSIYEQKKEWNEALEMLNFIEGDLWNDLRWRSMARISISKGQLKKAKKLLEQLLEKFPNSLYRGETETLLMSL